MTNMYAKKSNIYIEQELRAEIFAKKCFLKVVSVESLLR